MSAATCERAGCDEPHKARGMCDKHYGRERGHRSRPDRVLATRARNRATALLAKAYPEEFQALLAKCLANVQAEAARLQQLAEAEGLDPWQGIVRLRTGPKPDDEEPEDRIDLTKTSSCDACNAFHLSGHACQPCADREWEDSGPDVRKEPCSTPLGQLSPEQRVERALRSGRSAQWIANNMVEPLPFVLGVLDRLRAKQTS